MMDALTTRNAKEQAYHIQIHGLVQGVGFRPTIWNLARHYGIRGRVSNNGNGVQILLAGTEEKVRHFIVDLTRHPPPLAQVTAVVPRPIPLSVIHEDTFVIADSDQGAVQTGMIPDAATVCRQDNLDPGLKK